MKHNFEDEKNRKPNVATYTGKKTPSPKSKQKFKSREHIYYVTALCCGVILYGTFIHYFVTF